MLVFNTSKHLFQAVAELYPSTLVGTPERDTVYDFCLNVSRKWSGLSVPYHVASGRKHFRVSERQQLLPVFEWGFNWCVASFQHQYLAIHAAVLERNGQALIMPAPPGSGKSTLCAVMMQEGWRLLSDEMCLIDLESCQISPFVRPVSLKNESLELLAKWYPTARIKQVTPGTTKGTVGYLLPNDASWLHYTQAAAPAWVIFPKYIKEQVDISLNPISKANAFMHLAHNSFNYNVLSERAFDCLTRVTQQIQAYRLEYSDIDQAIAELNKLC